MLRMVALAVALCTGAAGALPSVESYRCLSTGRRMERRCCPKSARSEAPPLAVGRPCCQRLAAAAREARATGPDGAPRVAAPALAGLLAFAPLDRLAGAPIGIATAARGRPPGDRLRALSQILRI
jgi:hypothetical protein